MPNNLLNELGLTGASLSYHMRVLKSQKLVNIVKKKVESHGIVQTSLPHINREVSFGKESIIFEIYTKMVKSLVLKSINKTSYRS